MPQGKLAETKNQHYVSQFYQRSFSVDENHKTIGFYVIGQGKYIHKAPIKNQSSGDYFYSTNQEVEKALGGIEVLASKVISQIIQILKGSYQRRNGQSFMFLFFCKLVVLWIE